jgi:hypothetical protein
MAIQQYGSTTADNYQVVWTAGGEILITTDDEFVTSETLEFLLEAPAAGTIPVMQYQKRRTA